MLLASCAFGSRAYKSTIDSSAPYGTVSLIAGDAAAPKQPAAKKLQDSAPADKRVLAEEHRKNISAAIRMKWADPEYRMRALSGMRGGIVQAKRQSTSRVRFLGVCPAI